MACWSRKAAISLKRVNIEKRLYYGRRIRTQQRCFGGIILNPLRLTPPTLNWRFATAPKTPIENCGETSAHRGIVYAVWKVYRIFLGIGECGHSQGLPEIFCLPPIISGTGKATDFKFCTRIYRSIGTKALKNLGKVAMGVVRKSRKFSGHPHIGHIARSYLRQHSTAFLFNISFTSANLLLHF